MIYLMDSTIQRLNDQGHNYTREKVRIRFRKCNNIIGYLFDITIAALDRKE